MHAVFPLIALSLLAAPVSAAAPAHAPHWTVDKAASQLGFRATMSGAAVDGRFNRWDATIVFDPQNLNASRISAVIDLASAVTGDATRDEALPSSDWLGVRAHPRATFVSRTFTAAGPGRYVAAGELTLRGVKRLVSLPFTLTMAGDVAKVTGRTTIDRTAFGVGQGPFKTGDMVATEVAIVLNLSARRAS